METLMSLYTPLLHLDMKRRERQWMISQRCLKDFHTQLLLVLFVNCHPAPLFSFEIPLCGWMDVLKSLNESTALMGTELVARQ